MAKVKRSEKDYPIGTFVRTCQECFNVQAMKDPGTIKDPKEKWREAKCRYCGSEALDYGSETTDPNDNSWAED